MYFSYVKRPRDAIFIPQSEVRKIKQKLERCLPPRELIEVNHQLDMHIEQESFSALDGTGRLFSGHMSANSE